MLISKKRLKKRNTDSNDKILERFHTAYKEINEVTKYNYVVVNDNLEDAINKAYKMVETIHFDNAYYRHDIGAKAIAVCSLSGSTARMVSRFRPAVPIVGITTDEKAWRRLYCKA